MNQELISIIIDGYSLRLTINEGAKIFELIYNVFQEVELKRELNERIIRIFKISGMATFFGKFNCHNEILLLVE